MAEPADAGDSKSPEGNLLWVRFPLRALNDAEQVCEAKTIGAWPGDA